MNLKVNDNKIDRVTSQTVNGLNVTVFLEASELNSPLPETGYMDLVGFDPSQINVSVDLKRNGTIHSLINTNLALLAAEATMLKGGFMWFMGLPVQTEGPAKTSIVKRSVFVDFKGHYNLSGDDELMVNVTLNRSAFGSAINSNTSMIQVEVNESIGVEYQLNKFNVHSITAELNQDKITLGDNVTAITLHSFEKDWKKGIFRQVMLSSDRLDFSANSQQLDLRHWASYPSEIADVLFSFDSVNPSATNPLRFPNSYRLFDGNGRDEVDKAQLSFTLNPQNVLATQNYVFFWTYESSKEIVAKALQMQSKHDEKNGSKLPLSI